MNLDGAQLKLRPVASATPSENTLHKGEVLKAVVVKVTRSGQATLQIGERSVQTAANSGLRPGQQLTVLVEKVGQPASVRILDSTPANRTHSESPATTMSRRSAPGVPQAQVPGSTGGITSNRPLQLQLPNAGPLQGPLAAGQRFVATVSALGPQQTVLQIAPRGGETAAGQTLELPARLPLAVGEAVVVRVESAGPPPVLRVTPQQQESQAIGQALRLLLPRAGPIAPLFETLSQALGTGTERGALSEPIQVLARQLLRRLSTPERLATAQGLRQAVSESGLFMEARLARGSAPSLPQTDTKAALLRLMDLLRPAENDKPVTPSPLTQAAARNQSPVEAVSALALGRSNLSELGLALLKHGEAALARIQVHQVHSSTQTDQNNQTWIVELPVRTPQGHESVSLRIARERHHRQGHGSGDNWSISLELGDSRHGALNVVVGLQAFQVNVTFWAERDSTAQLFREQLPQLYQRLAEAGLEVTRLTSRVGRPPPPEPGANLPNRLFSERV